MAPILRRDNWRTFHRWPKEHLPRLNPARSKATLLLPPDRRDSLHSGPHRQTYRHRVIHSHLYLSSPSNPVSMWILFETSTWQTHSACRPRKSPLWSK